MATPRTVLVTRPEPDATAFAERIAALGHKPLIAPLLDIRFHDAKVSLDDVAALVFTSANGVRALVHAVPDAPSRGIDVFAVGEATASAAREAGFSPVSTADGDVESLARTIAAALKGRGGTVLHVAGRDRAGDLVALLERDGIPARRAVLYAAEPATAFPGDVRDALAHGAVDDVVIFSPRTARQFVTLMEKAELSPSAAGLRLLALSPSVAEAATGLAFADVAVAPRRDQAAILEFLASDRTQASMTDTDKSKDDKSKDDKDKAAAGGDDKNKKKKNKSAKAPVSESAPPEESGDTASETHERRLSPALIVLIALVVLVAASGVALTQAPVRGWVAERLAPAQAAKTAALSRRVAGLEQDIAKMRAQASQQAPQQGQDTRVSALADKVDGLADKMANIQSGGVAPDRVAQLEQRLDALSGKVDSLGARVGQVTQPPADAVVGRVTLLAFVSALNTGHPFAALADAARKRITALGGDNASLARDFDQLAPDAASGVPTATALWARANVLHLVAGSDEKGTAASPSQGDGAGTGLWARVKARIAGLVTIRRIGDKGAKKAPAAQHDLALVRAALAAGDLDAAAAGVNAIDGAALSAGSRAALDALRRDIGLRRTADRLARALDAALAAPVATVP